MAILKRGSSGPDVQALQQRLSDLGFDPNGLDGNFGPGTEAAVRAFQAVNGLGVDGKVGPDTLAALQASVSNAGGGGLSADATGGMDATGDGNGDAAGPPPPPPPPSGSKLLNDDDYQQAAKLLNCDIAAIKAVAEVESRGAGFLPDGRPKILFERHKFRSFTGGKFDATNPDISNKTPGGYGAGGPHQWDRFNVAAALNRDAAIKACSWGKFQVMGFNFEVCGFSNLDDFYNAMQTSEGEHLKAFLNFIAGNNLGGALRNHQWATLAAGYNGADYKINQYDTKLASAYKKYSS
jgi:peptidoglycan hydrolase-like protein with peptidoglycan-binding domain